MGHGLAVELGQEALQHLQVRCSMRSSCDHPVACTADAGILWPASQRCRWCRPWLLEVNHSPSFTTDMGVDRRVKEALLRDTLQLVRARDRMWSPTLSGQPGRSRSLPRCSTEREREREREGDSCARAAWALGDGRGPAGVWACVGGALPAGCRQAGRGGPDLCMPQDGLHGGTLCLPPPGAQAQMRGGS